MISTRCVRQAVVGKAGIPRRRHGDRHRHPRRHPREDVRVGIGVGVVEFQLNCSPRTLISRDYWRDVKEDWGLWDGSPPEAEAFL